MILVTHAHNDHFADAPALAKLNNVPIYNAGGLGSSIVSLGIVPAAGAAFRQERRLALSVWYAGSVAIGSAPVGFLPTRAVSTAERRQTLARDRVERPVDLRLSGITSAPSRSLSR